MRTIKDPKSQYMDLRFLPLWRWNTQINFFGINFISFWDAWDFTSETNHFFRFAIFQNCVKVILLVQKLVWQIPVAKRSTEQGFFLVIDFGWPQLTPTYLFKLWPQMTLNKFFKFLTPIWTFSPQMTRCNPSTHFDPSWPHRIPSKFLTSNDHD